METSNKGKYSKPIAIMPDIYITITLIKERTQALIQSFISAAIPK